MSLPAGPRVLAAAVGVLVLLTGCGSGGIAVATKSAAASSADRWTGTSDEDDTVATTGGSCTGTATSAISVVADAAGALTGTQTYTGSHAVSCGGFAVMGKVVRVTGHETATQLTLRISEFAVGYGTVTLTRVGNHATGTFSSSISRDGATSTSAGTVQLTCTNC